VRAAPAQAPAQGLALIPMRAAAAIAFVLAGHAAAFAAAPIVEVIGDRPPRVASAAPVARPTPPAGGFVVFRGSGVPPMAAEQVDVRVPLQLKAAYAGGASDKVRVSAAVEWGDGSRSEATVAPEPLAPAWAGAAAALAAIPSSQSFQGQVTAAHAYAAAEAYTIRVTLQVVRESDKAAFSFTRTHRLRVRDPALAEQPWRFDVDSIMLVCPDGQACAFPLALDGRVEAQAQLKFGPSWLAAHTAYWEWGDGASSVGQVNVAGGVGRASGTHAYAKGGKVTLKLTLTGKHKDGTPESRTQTIELLVADVAIDDIAGPGDSIPGGLPADFQANFRYKDGKRKRKATWSWGDGQTGAGLLSERDGAGSVSGRHTYGTAGQFKVTLAIADGQAEVTRSVEVTVSKPGTVSASGMVPCPAGVLVGDPKKAGQARMELNAHHDGAVPSGVFHLSGSGFDFQADHFETLAVSATQAHAAGSGTFNGQRPFGFTVDVWTTAAADGRPQQQWARIRVTDEAKQKNVFDNDLFDGALQPMTDARIKLDAR
jgi:hypothetical protein